MSNICQQSVQCFDYEEQRELIIVLHHTVSKWSEECHGMHSLSSEDTEVVCIIDHNTMEDVYLSQEKIAAILKQKCTSFGDSEPVDSEQYQFEYDY